MDNKRPLIAHLCLFCSGAFWGLMAPVGKDAMLHGIDGIDLVSFRVLGGAVLFWLTSFFTAKEHVPLRDVVKFAFAGLFALVFNQCSYTIGLGMTSPSNSSIMTTSMPIFAMILSFLILKEPITWKKVLGVLMGCSGAVIIILTSAHADNAKVGNIWGDLLCITAQLSFALYLSLFKNLLSRYSLFTINKWMFTWATLSIWPFTLGHVASIDFVHVPMSTWWESAYVIFFGTYLGYICMMIGQKTLRPTVISVYNYVQPLVSVSVSVMVGLAVFGFTQAVAAILIFSGVWLVVKSKSKRDMAMEKEGHSAA
ncbi:MAG: DMT family transporter [Prevotella sp.]|nr:DMT family transporter [Prevotella sp.]MDD7045914.1 DMT family transporter [Prevotella sp.]MDY5546266.1 DMT family transporter [Prevotella sp.]